MLFNLPEKGYLLRFKCNKFNFGWGFGPDDPLGKLITVLPIAVRWREEAEEIRMKYELNCIRI